MSVIATTEPTAQIPETRQVLQRALGHAQQATQIDASGTDPHAAVQTYARAIPLLRWVESRARQADEVTRLRNIVSLLCEARQDLD